jgi:hypothetical protein
MYGPIPLPPSQKNITNRKPFHTPRMEKKPKPPVLPSATLSSFNYHILKYCLVQRKRDIIRFIMFHLEEWKGNNTLIVGFARVGRDF